MTKDKIGIGHNQKNEGVSDYSIKKTVQEVVVSSFTSWEKNKLKKGIDTEHVILDIIAPKERLVATIIQSLQTSLGQKLWEKLTVELAKQNSFEICDKKLFYAPKTNFFNQTISEWKSKRENNENITLDGYVEDLIKKIKEFKKIIKM